MATEMLSYCRLGDQFNWPEAARMLVRRLRLPRQKAHDGKVLLSVHRSDGSRRRRPPFLRRCILLHLLRSPLGTQEPPLSRPGRSA